MWYLETLILVTTMQISTLEWFQKVRATMNKAGD